MKSATALYPNSVVGPYDWTYFPAEVPEGALIVRFEFRKLWASQADEVPAHAAGNTDAAGESQQAGSSSSSSSAEAGAAASGGPLVCFALGSLPLPSDHEPQYESLEAAAKAAGGALSPFGGAMGAVTVECGQEQGDGPGAGGGAGAGKGGGGQMVDASAAAAIAAMVGEGWGGGGGKGNGTVGEGGSGLGGKRGGGAGQSHCALFHSTAVFSLPADQQPVAGVWNVGVLSEWGPARTQSQMVLRGGIPPIQPVAGVWNVGVFSEWGAARTQSKMVLRGTSHTFDLALTAFSCFNAPLLSGRFCNDSRTPLPLHPLSSHTFLPARPPVTPQAANASTGHGRPPLPKLLISIYPEPPSSSSASSASPLPSWLTGHARSANASPSVQLRRMALLGPSNRGAPAGPSFSVQPRSETEEQAGSSNSGDVRGNGGQEGRGGAEGGAGVDVWWSEGRMDIGSWQAVADPGSWHLLLSHPASSAARSGSGNGSTASNSSSSSIGVNGSTSVSSGGGGSGGREGGDGGWWASLWGGSWAHGQQGGAADEGEGGGEVCVSIQWKAATCFPRLTGSQCQWPLIPLEPHLLSWSYESGLDAAYLPPASPAPPSLWASWFPVPVAASPSPARPSWAFLSLAPPFGARGGVLSIHLRLRPLRQGPGADGDGEGQGGEAESGGSGNNSSAGGVAVGSSGAAPTAFVYLLVRAGGLPSLTRFDASAVAPATDMAARGGQLSLELIHPAEVTTFVAVGLDAAAPRTSEGGKEESDEEGEGEGGDGEWAWEWEVRVVQHGCPNGCSGSPCHVMADGAFQFGVYYCFCDRSHGGVDCSIETVSQLGIEQQRWALVGSNVVAVLPAMVSLYLGAYPEWVMFSLNGLCSALYHLCDTDGWCAARYPTLQFADFYSSFLAVLLAFLHVAQVPIWPRFLFFVLASFSTAVMAVDRATSGWSIVVLLALGAAALITGWFIRLAALRRSSSASSSAAPHAPHTPLEAASCAVQSAEEQGGSRHGHVEEEGASLLPPPCSSDGEWPLGGGIRAVAQSKCLSLPHVLPHLLPVPCPHAYLRPLPTCISSSLAHMHIFVPCPHAYLRPLPTCISSSLAIMHIFVPCPHAYLRPLPTCISSSLAHMHIFVPCPHAYLFPLSRLFIALQSCLNQELFPHTSSLRTLAPTRCRAQVAVVLRVLLALLATFHVPSLLLGALAALLAASSFLVEVPATYWIWHSVWHVCIYSAAFFFMLASPPPNKHGSLPLALSPRSPPPKRHGSFRSHRNSDDVSVAGSSSGDGSSEGGWPMGKRVAGCSVGREVEVDEERGLLLIRDDS
ncbi:unnamed protein product [Closterium sp. NIES-64]|nr:unnamed protein product [Closterium sp. NIES-64]